MKTFNTHNYGSAFHRLQVEITSVYEAYHMSIHDLLVLPLEALVNGLSYPDLVTARTKDLFIDVVNWSLSDRN